MSIVITSQLVRRDRIKSLQRRKDPLAHLKRIKSETGRLRSIAMTEAITEGLLELVKKDIGMFSLTVARKTGKFRGAVNQAVRNVLSTVTEHRGKTMISWSSIVNAILDLDDEEYFKYHIRGRGFYKNPTVKNTFPLRFARFKAMAVKILQIKIPIKLRKYGIEDRVTFTV